MTEAATTPEQQNELANEVSTEIQRVIDKIGQQLDGEPSHIAMSALISLISGAVLGNFFDGEQRKAAAMFLLSSAIRVSLEVGITDKELASAMVEPGFYGKAGK